MSPDVGWPVTNPWAPLQVAALRDGPYLHRVCRVCGCTEDAPCLDPVVGPCAWLTDDLCDAHGDDAVVVA